MQLSNGHFDLNDCAITPGEYDIQQSFDSQKRHNFNKNTFTFFELSKILKYKKAIFISKLNYWLNKCGRSIEIGEAKWIYNTMKDWAKQFNWSLSTLKRVVYSLEEEGIIISKKINAKKWNHTKWYTIDYNKLYLLLGTSKNGAYYFKKKRTNRIYQNEPIIISNNINNYTNNISSNKNFNKGINNFKNKTIEENILDIDKKEIINKMVYVWNKVFECSAKPIRAYSNKKNQHKLLNLYRKTFSSDLDKWREYACKVNSSQFLMGEKKTKNNFKAVFSWLIKENTIEKILNGEYGVGDRELDMNNISKNIEERKEEIVNKMDKKLSEYMKIKINDKKEREEFKKYVGKASITEDDSYGILKNIIKQVPKSYILEREEYKEIKENIYESYVMKKYLGATKLDIRKKMRERTREIDEITDVKEKIRILRGIEEKIKTKEYLKSNPQNNKEIGNYNSGLLESILLTNPKKEVRYLKDSSGESLICQ